jgi:hypothetical protein
MKTMKKLTDDQSYFFLHNYQNYVAIIQKCKIPILDDIGQVVIGNMNERIGKIKMDIADSNLFTKEILILVNKYLEKLRQVAEKKEYFELCYNISQTCALIYEGISLYKNIEID